VADYGRDLSFGISVLPDAGELGLARRLAVRADEVGLDLVGIQDHPYQRRFVDTFALIADLLARTQRISVFPDVANLPLRGAAMLAKAAASPDVLSDGTSEIEPVGDSCRRRRAADARPQPAVVGPARASPLS
jgi:alkanesulfonate monooxygenase SsuD/methylene tetrahydromethanopterin reductase-like flavin-dependent oxidoreductase (luciferase family)